MLFAQIPPTFAAARITYSGRSDSKKTSTSSRLDPNLKSLQENLSERLGAAVAIKHNKSGKGILEISYHSLDELDGILNKIK